MKLSLRVAFFLVLIASLIPSSALAAGLSDRYIWGDSFTLDSGETLDEDLYILGGNVVLEDGSLVDGDVLLAGGNLTVYGEITGNIHATGGNVELRSSAVVQGDIDLLGANISRSPGATVEGEVNTGVPGGININPGRANLPWQAMMAAANPIGKLISIFLWSFLLAALAVVTVMFWPRQVERVGATAVTQPVISGGLGFVTFIAALIVLVILTITILLIPVSFLGLITLALLVAFGWISLGYELGDRLMQALKTEWAKPVSAGLGTLLLTLVATSVNEVVPCIGWTIPFLITIMGVGSAVITRLGTQPYPPDGSLAASPRVPLGSAVPPAAPLVTPTIPAGSEIQVPPEVPPASPEVTDQSLGAEVYPPEDEIPPAS